MSALIGMPVEAERGRLIGERLTAESAKRMYVKVRYTEDND